MELDYQRLQVAITMGIADGLRLARKEKKDEEDTLKIATITQYGNPTKRKKAK